MSRSHERATAPSGASLAAETEERCALAKKPAAARIGCSQSGPIEDRPQVTNLPHIAASRKTVLAFAMMPEGRDQRAPPIGRTQRVPLPTCPTKSSRHGKKGIDSSTKIAAACGDMTGLQRISGKFTVPKGRYH